MYWYDVTGTSPNNVVSWRACNDVIGGRLKSEHCLRTSFRDAFATLKLERCHAPNVTIVNLDATLWRCSDVVATFFVLLTRRHKTVTKQSRFGTFLQRCNWTSSEHCQRTSYFHLIEMVTPCHASVPGEHWTVIKVWQESDYSFMLRNKGGTHTVEMILTSMVLVGVSSWHPFVWYYKIFPCVWHSSLENISLCLEMDNIWTNATSVRRCNNDNI